MNPAALTHLVSTCERPVRRWLRRTGVPLATIDDVAQEVWLRLLRLGNEDAISNPQAFVNMTARNALCEMMSRACERKPHHSVDDFLDQLVRDDDAEDLVLSRQRQLAVRGALARLKPRQRDFILLHLDGMSYKQIAAFRDTTPRVVLRELNKAYVELRSNRALREIVS